METQEEKQVSYRGYLEEEKEKKQRKKDKEKDEESETNVKKENTSLPLRPKGK